MSKTVKSKFPVVTLRLDKIVGGGQALGTLESGKKLFAWGGLPNELVSVQITKKRSSMAEGRVIEVLEASADRIEPIDTGSYLSTSPWQIMTPQAESHYKAALIEEAFEMHDIVLPNPITVCDNQQRFGYRNKVEFSWFWDKELEKLDLAFFTRGTRGKIAVDGTSLAHENINVLARQIRDLLRKKDIEAYSLKTLLIRCDRDGNCVWQLYTKDDLPDIISADEADQLPARGGEVIYSDPRSPASKISKRLSSFGELSLKDTILDVAFTYKNEGFFQVNLAMYELALKDIQLAIETKPIVDMYSGVGTIGLTLGSSDVTLVESDDYAVEEMRRNIKSMNSKAKAVHAASEKALEYITSDKLIIVDPPRVGLHNDVIDRLLEVKPSRIIYLSCNPVTQARDVMRLATAYGVKSHSGYNFFPCTPHIEHLVVLDLKP